MTNYVPLKKLKRYGIESSDGPIAGWRRRFWENRGRYARAAFKAVNDHKQVAVLVPTTVLAQQHYANFKERFESFAVEVAVLSRFQSKAEQKETLEKLKKGRVDIIIGTHRLLSKDVVFSDLGLIVIDEEQRFGVKHKETLKELKKGGCAYLDSYPLYLELFICLC